MVLYNSGKLEHIIIIIIIFMGFILYVGFES